MEKVQKKKVSFFKKTMEVGDTSTATIYHWHMESAWFSNKHENLTT